MRLQRERGGTPRPGPSFCPKDHLAVLPPSTRYDAPVINDALSDARNTMVWAISSGRPTRLSGTVAAKPALLSGVPVKRSSIPVSIGPGGNQVNAYSRCRGFERSRLCQAFNSVLARRVYRGAGSAG